MKNKTQSKNKSEGIQNLPITQQVLDTIVNKNDPVAAQYYPSAEENKIHAYQSPDPIGDNCHSPTIGIVHRYPDRVLLKITDICAVYCRFCFRKEMVGKGAGILHEEEMESAFRYIENRPEIREVILSGGDPMTLSNRRLKYIVERLNQINHIQFIRFHTRTPIVNPSRINTTLIDIINSSKKAIYIVLHVNHAQEINEKIIDMLDTLSMSKAILLSQSVLLKNINDNVEALTNLFTTLTTNRVKPYYLHHPDLATGTEHFRVTIKHGQQLMQELRGNTSGLCIPTYVLDIPKGYGKVPIHASYLEELSEGDYIVTDYKKHKHSYKEHNCPDDRS